MPSILKALKSSILPKALFFLMNLASNCQLVQKKACSKCGTPARISTAGSRTGNISVMAAMTKKGVLYHKIRFCAFNGEAFKERLIELHQLCCNLNIDPVFVLDNAKIHNYRGLSDKIQNLG